MKYNNSEKGYKLSNLISNQIINIVSPCSSRKSHVWNLYRGRLHGKYFISSPLQNTEMLIPPKLMKANHNVSTYLDQTSTPLNQLAQQIVFKIRGKTK